MNRKTLFIAGGAVAVAALVTGGIALAFALQPGEPDEQYVASSLHELRVVQQGAHSYDVSFALPDDVDADADGLVVQLTDTPDYREDAATEAEFTLAGDRVLLDTSELDAGDHFLWVTAGEAQASATVTIPDMAPRVWLDGETPHIEFDQAGDSSWSSYVDPEGKNVYESASAVFDDTAEPLAEGLAITETSYRIDAPDAARPYYFLVFTGHGGDSTFVSSPLFAQAEQGDLAVELRSIDGAPTYVVSGFLGSRKADDVERSLRLRVGTFDAADPGSTFFVENSAQDADTGRFRFVVPASQLADGYNDLAVFLTEDGATLECSLDATGVDLTQRIVSDRSVFGLRRAEALQLTRLDLAYERLQVSLERAGAGAALHVSGTFTEAASGVGYQLVVKDTSGEQHVVGDRVSTARGFSYVVDLGRLAQPSVWYDVEFLDPADGTSTPISTLSVADMRQWVETASRTYAFADYDGLLKVFFDATPFANAHAELATVGGVPSLVATGDLVGIARTDASLRIRTGGSTVTEVPNTSTSASRFRFVVPLTTLTSSGTWYDVLFHQKSADRLIDLPSASANLSQTLAAGARTYGFREWDGQLKVTFDAVPASVAITSSELVDAAGTPTLRVTGTADAAAAAGVVLRIRSGAEIIDVPNTATAAGAVLFERDLSGLTQPGVWYDVVVGTSSTNTFVDVPAATADLAQNVTLSGRAYAFHEWNSQLKVAFADVSIAVVPDAVHLVDVSGAATLRVTGAVTGTTNDDAFLRIRTGAQTVDVPNTATAAGEALFEYDLTGLTQPGTWYDLLVGVTSTSQLTDLTPSIADLDETLVAGVREYGFRQWDGDLKVTFADNTPSAVISAAAVLDVSGVPTLRVTGTVANTTNDDVFLRIRSGSEVIDVPNTATDAGEALFAYDLSGLTKSGTWYDLLVGVTSRNTLAELPSSLADLGQTVSIAARNYAFHEWYGALKVAFESVTLGEGQSLRIDFGPDDVTNGHATVGPDANGKYWNNITQQGGTSNAVPNGRSVSTLVTTDNVPTTTRVTISDANWRSNGIVTGGLTNPNSALLGEYAIPTATQDYFFVQSSGTATLTLSGLDPWREYDLRLFGTRGANDVRKTTYTVTGAEGSQQALLQTSGTGVGAGGYNGNNNTIVTIEDMQPNADGTLKVAITATAGTFGYLGFLEITGDAALTPVPAEVQRWVNQDAADPLADDSVLFIGSSSIRRWETLTRDFADYDVIQRGWGGSWLSGVNDYSPWVAWPYHPRAIVMWAGTNDLNGGQSAQWVLDEYREFVTNMRANSPGSDFFWISITPNPGNADKDAVRVQTNALIKAEIEADTTGKLHYIDVATYFENVRDADPALFASYYVDSLHMTRAGYAKWIETVRPALEAVAPPNKTMSSNPATLQDGEKLFFDFGPSGNAEGDVTNVDGNGNHWNNWVPTAAGGLVNVGEHIAGLVDSTGRDTGIGMTIAAGFQANGKTTGGLLAPDAAHLGELGVATATEDFFYSSADGKQGGSDDDLPGGLMITGLDPNQEYEFRFFGSRSASDTRVTEYAVIGANSGSAQLQTSGTGVSHDGTKNGNDSEIAVVSGIRPDAFGQAWVDLTVIQGSYAYLNAMEVVAGAPEPSGFAARSLVAAPDDEAAAGGTGDEASEVPAGTDGSADAADGSTDAASPEPAPEAPSAPSDVPSDPAVVPGGSAPSRAERSSGPRDAGGRRAP